MLEMLETPETRNEKSYDEFDWDPFCGLNLWGVRLNFSLAERVGYPLKECQTFKAEAMAEGADVTRRMALYVWKLW